MSSAAAAGATEGELNLRGVKRARCTAYQEDQNGDEMYKYLCHMEREVDLFSFPLYMDGQPHVSEDLRSRLVDWLIRVHRRFMLVPETLHLAINLVDRFLSRCSVKSSKVLPLLGVSCLLVASKFVELQGHSPRICDLVEACGRSCSEKDVSTSNDVFPSCMRLLSNFFFLYFVPQIVKVEAKILRTLQYRVMAPTPLSFLPRALEFADADDKIKQLSYYILDFVLLWYDHLYYFPSKLAAAAVFLARRMVGQDGWSLSLSEHTSYCENEIEKIARNIYDEMNSFDHANLNAVKEKYSAILS